MPKSFIFVYRIHGCKFEVFCKYNINIINIFILIVGYQSSVFKVQRYLTLMSVFFTNVSVSVRTASSL